MRPVRLVAAVAALATGLAGASVRAALPEPWQMNLQPAATPVMQQMIDFHNLLLVLIFLIAGFVLVLLLVTMWKFNARRSPVPGRATHNTVLEVVWTVVPVLILVLIAVPSFRLLYHQDVVPEADMTVKATGHQWYWSYEYPDHDRIAFDALMVPDDQLQPGQPRLLQTDNAVVVPVDTTVRVQVTAADVLHAWAVPAFGVKIDAVPGRLNETWFRVVREGTFYGQCSELCGVNHGFMPIMVQVVSKQQFAEWVEGRRQAANEQAGPAAVARNEIPARRRQAQGRTSHE